MGAHTAVRVDYCVCVCVGRLNSMDKVLRMLAFYLCVVLNFFGIGKFCFVSLFHMPSIFVRLCLWNVVPTPLRSECYKTAAPTRPLLHVTVGMALSVRRPLYEAIGRCTNPPSQRGVRRPPPLVQIRRNDCTSPFQALCGHTGSPITQGT